LGLYISKAYIEAHGGKISAENNSGPTKGATFSFTIPLTTDPVTKDEKIVNIMQSVEEKKSSAM
jgi:K+-sensing histidine kinase KdpD